MSDPIQDTEDFDISSIDPTTLLNNVANDLHKIENVKALAEGHETIEVKMTDLDKPKENYPQGPAFNDTKGTLGLEEELSEADKQEAIDIARQNLIEADAYNADKNLDEDKLKIDGQNFAVLQWVGPKLTAKTEINGIRIMGAFDTVEDAEKHIETFTKEEKAYDTGIIELYKFVPTVPLLTPETQIQQDSFLNDIIISHKIKKEEDKQFYEIRKTRLANNKDRIIEKTSEPEFKSVAEASQDLTAKTDIKKDIKNKNVTETQERLRKKLEERKGPDERRITSMLTRPGITMHGQNYAAICYVGQSNENKRIAMKLKGVFNSYESCQSFCQEAMENNNDYDILVAEMYSWIPSDPAVDKINQVHSNDQLNNMFKEHTKEGKLSNNYTTQYTKNEENKPVYTKAEIEKMLSVHGPLSTEIKTEQNPQRISDISTNDFDLGSLVLDDIIKPRSIISDVNLNEVGQSEERRNRHAGQYTEHVETTTTVFDPQD